MHVFILICAYVSMLLVVLLSFPTCQTSSELSTVDSPTDGCDTRDIAPA